MRFESALRVPAPQEQKKPQKIVELADEDVKEDVEDAVELDEGDYELEDGVESGVQPRKDLPANDNGDKIEELTEADFIEVLEPGELQEKDVVEAFEMQGFEGLKISATLEKKDARKEAAGERNEDNIIANAETGLIGVLDGLGGEGEKGAGAKASVGAEVEIPNAYKKALSRIKTLDGADIQKELVENQLAGLGATDAAIVMNARKGLTDMMEGAMLKSPEMCKKALALLEAISQANGKVAETGGKTTACVGFVHKAPDGTHWAVVANIGDSAAYKRRANGELVPLTDEDSFFNLLRDAGTLPPETMAAMKAKPDEKFPIPFTESVIKALGKEYAPFLGKRMPFSYKTLKLMMVKSMGAETSQAKLAIRRLEPGDSLIMATDGVVDKFEDPNTDETNLAELAKAFSGSTQTERLNHLRKASKGRTTYKKDDDIAIVSAMAA